MQILTNLKKGLDKFGVWWSFIVFILIVLPTLESIILRFLFNKPTIWSQELTILTFGIYFIIGGAYCESRNGHISMDIFSCKVKGYGKVMLEIVYFLCAMLVLGILIYFSALSSLDTMRTLEKTQTIWQPVVWPSRLAVFIGCTMLLIRTLISSIERVLLEVREIKGGIK